MKETGEMEEKVGRDPMFRGKGFSVTFFQSSKEQRSTLVTAWSKPTTYCSWRRALFMSQNPPTGFRGSRGDSRFASKQSRSRSKASSVFWLSLRIRWCDNTLLYSGLKASTSSLPMMRSTRLEEHTSELQSLAYLACRLL